MQIFYEVEKPEGHSDDIYVALDGSIISREDGHTPNGNKIGQRWVYRDAMGEFVDVDRYRNDLFDRFDLTLVFLHFDKFDLNLVFPDD